MQPSKSRTLVQPTYSLQAGPIHQNEPVARTGAVEAGGMFAALVHDRGALAPELTDVRRFVNSWEKVASVELRAGSADGIDAYESHGRVAGGSRVEMLDALYEAWKRDVEEGKTTS